MNFGGLPGGFNLFFAGGPHIFPGLIVKKLDTGGCQDIHNALSIGSRGRK